MKFERYQGRDGQHYWRLRADNGEPIADSAEGYVNAEDRDHGIELVQRFAKYATVEDVETRTVGQ